MRVRRSVERGGAKRTGLRRDSGTVCFRFVGSRSHSASVWRLLDSVRTSSNAVERARGKEERTTDRGARSSDLVDAEFVFTQLLRAVWRAKAGKTGTRHCPKPLQNCLASYIALPPRPTSSSTASCFGPKMLRPQLQVSIYSYVIRYI